MKGPTITLIKSSNNRICGGFTMVSWDNSNPFDDYKKDNKAFVFSVDLKTIYRPQNTSNAVYHAHCGPIFGGNSLALNRGPLNKYKGSYCSVNGLGYDEYYIPSDNNGNSPLTGAG